MNEVGKCHDIILLISLHSEHSKGNHELVLDSTVVKSCCMHVQNRNTLFIIVCVCVLNVENQQCDYIPLV